MHNPGVSACVHLSLSYKDTSQFGLGSTYMGLPRCSVVKNLPASAGYTGLIPGIGRSSGERNGNPFQYPCLEKSWIEEPGGL